MDINSAKKNMLMAGKALAIFAVVASALVGITHQITKDKIEENERLALLKSLHVLVPSSWHDNDMFTDNVEIDIPELNFKKKSVTIYRARKGKENVAAIFNVTAPDGYSGPIKLLIAINDRAEIIGVRVIAHKETPGLGDAIDTEKSNWIRGFDRRSLTDPIEKRWRVKKDGGVFDQFTGATITPRAVVKTTHDTLKYFVANKALIFSKSRGDQDAK